MLYTTTLIKINYIQFRDFSKVWPRGIIGIAPFRLKYVGKEGGMCLWSRMHCAHSCVRACVCVCAGVVRLVLTSCLRNCLHIWERKHHSREHGWLHKYYPLPGTVECL